MYKKEIRDKARSLFVEGGLTYLEVARRIGMSVNNLKRWGKRGNWKQERSKFQSSAESLDAQIARAKFLVVDKLSKTFDGAATFDSQTVYATVKAGVLLLLLQADSGKGNSRAVLDLLETLNEIDERVLRMLKSAARSRDLAARKGTSKRG